MLLRSCRDSEGSLCLRAPPQKLTRNLGENLGHKKALKAKLFIACVTGPQTIGLFRHRFDTDAHAKERTKAMRKKQFYIFDSCTNHNSSDLQVLVVRVTLNCRRASCCAATCCAGIFRATSRALLPERSSFPPCQREPSGSAAAAWRARARYGSLGFLVPHFARRVFPARERP